jgi:hypothetical protein
MLLACRTQLAARGIAASRGRLASAIGAARRPAVGPMAKARHDRGASFAGVPLPCESRIPPAPAAQPPRLLCSQADAAASLSAEDRLQITELCYLFDHLINTVCGRQQLLALASSCWLEPGSGRRAPRNDPALPHTPTHPPTPPPPPRAARPGGRGGAVRGGRRGARLRRAPAAAAAADPPLRAALPRSGAAAAAGTQPAPPRAAPAPAPQVHTPKASVRGRGNLAAYFKSTEPLARGHRHLTTNVLVHPHHLGARASSYRLLHRACMPPALVASGTIEDVLARGEGGAWRFVSRRFTMDPPAAAPPADAPPAAA